MHSHTPEQLRALLVALQPHWRSVRMDQVTALPGGYTNVNYRISCDHQLAQGNVVRCECVLRVPRQALTPVQRQAFLWELAYLRQLADSTVAAPEVLAANADQGLLLTAWIAGEHLHAAMPTPVQQVVPIVSHFGTLLPAQSRVYDPLAQLHLLDDTAQWLRVLGADCTNWLVDQRPRLVPAHNDLNPFNVLWRRGESPALVFLDWELAGLNHPGFDLVALHLGLARERSDATVQLAENHLNQLLGGDGRWLQLCYWLREYAWAVRQQQRGNQLAAVIAQRDLAKAVLRTYRSK